MGEGASVARGMASRLEAWRGCRVAFGSGQQVRQREACNGERGVAAASEACSGKRGVQQTARQNAAGETDKGYPARESATGNRRRT